jgi:hypothetical protein
VQEWSLPELPQRERQLFGFSGGGFGDPEVLGTTVHQIPQSGGLVDLPDLPFRLGNDVRWIRDVHIEYRADQLYYDNEELSYQLPRKNLIAMSFCALPARVDANGGLSIEMRPKAPLVLKIPDDRNLILCAIGCARRVGYTGDFESKELRPLYQDCGLSDKAKYCRGVLNQKFPKYLPSLAFRCSKLNRTAVNPLSLLLRTCGRRNDHRVHAYQLQ